MSRPRITLICYETPGLHLGPGLPGDADCVTFTPVYAGPGVAPKFGLAVIEPDDFLYDAKLAWISTFGCPPIEIVGEDADELPAGSIADPDGVCPECDTPFIDARARDRHQAATHCHRKHEVSE